MAAWGRGWLYLALHVQNCFGFVKNHVLTQQLSFSPACSFQCLHTLVSLKIAKRRNLPAKQRFLCLVTSWTHGKLFLSERALFSSATGNNIAASGNGLKVQVWVCVCVLFVCCTFFSVNSTGIQRKTTIHFVGSPKTTNETTHRSKVYPTTTKCHSTFQAFSNHRVLPPPHQRKVI